MIHQVTHNPINAIIFEITQKYLHTDVYINIMQYVDSGIPVLRKIRFDNTNISASPYRNNVEDIIDNLNFTKKCCRRI